jgi:di- and tripeptidase
MWLATKEGLTEKHTFSGCEDGVLSLVARNGIIYAGCRDGQIKIFDQDTKTLLRTLLVNAPPALPSSVSHQADSKTRNTDVLDMSVIAGGLYACLGNGWCQCWSSSFVSTALWEAHEHIVLSCVVTSTLGHEYQGKEGKAMLLTGGADSSIKVSPNTIKEYCGSLMHRLSSGQSMRPPECQVLTKGQRIPPKRPKVSNSESRDISLHLVLIKE